MPDSSPFNDSTGVLAYHEPLLRESIMSLSDNCDDDFLNVETSVPSYPKGSNVVVILPPEKEMNSNKTYNETKM